MRTKIGPPLVLALLLGSGAAATGGVVVSLTESDVDRALSIGRSFDPERARFHQPYVIAVEDSTLQQLEILTEFRRVVVFAEDRIRHGDHMFGLRQAEQALQPWRGRLTLVARLRFHPMNTYVMAPLYALTIGSPPLGPMDTRRTTLYANPAPRQRAGTPAPLTGAILEADFDAELVGQRAQGQQGQTIQLVLDDQVVARTSVAFSRLQ